MILQILPQTLVNLVESSALVAKYLMTAGCLTPCILIRISLYCNVPDSQLFKTRYVVICMLF